MILAAALVWVFLGLLTIAPAPGRPPPPNLLLALALAVCLGPVLFVYAFGKGFRHGMQRELERRKRP